MNYDFMLPAFGQGIVFAEPENKENAGSYEDESDSDVDNYPDFNFVVVRDFGCGGKPKQTVRRNFDFVNCSVVSYVF
jgi:hypothetical protein